MEGTNRNEDLQAQVSGPSPADQSAPSDRPGWENPNGSWDLVYSYTRAQAIDDGVLVDCGIFCVRQGGERVVDLLGFRYPVAMTAGAWGQITEGCTIETREHVIALAGCLNALKRAIALQKAAGIDSDTVHFDYQPFGNPSATVALWSLCGPGDTADPVLTIMLEGED